MKFIAFLIAFLMTFATQILAGETISMDNLVERGGLFYKKFTNTPFTGETLWVDPRGYGQTSGKWKNGKKYGEWNNYDSNGQLTSLLNYINGQLNGISIHYGVGDKILRTEMWKNDKLDGVSEYFNLDGSFSSRETFKAKTSKQKPSSASIVENGSTRMLVVKSFNYPVLPNLVMNI